MYCLSVGAVLPVRSSQASPLCECEFRRGRFETADGAEQGCTRETPPLSDLLPIGWIKSISLLQ